MREDDSGARSRWIRLPQMALVAAFCAGAALRVEAGMTSPWVKKKTWEERATGKLFYGGKNLLLGWTELITEPDEALWGETSLTAGILRGTWNAIGQTLGGAAQVVTFPYTSLDIPLPDGGVAWDRPETQSSAR